MKRLALAAALLFLAAPTRAHDFWLEPSTFHPLPGQTISVGLRVGQDFIGDAVPRDSASIAAFFVRQNGADQDISGSDRRDPAGFLRADGQATAIIGYASTGSDIELPPQKFESYLRQYGLEKIVAARAARGEQARPGRERFFRYAKALLSGQRASPSARKPLGFAFEIVPDEDPTARPGPFHGRVLYDGKPLTGTRVVALLKGDPSMRLSARSDARGAFTFALPRAGVWMVTSVHMVRASFFSRADWDSLWASLTFESPGRP